MHMKAGLSTVEWYTTVLYILQTCGNKSCWEAMVHLELKHYSVINRSLIAGLGKDIMSYHYHVLSKFLTYLEGLILTRQSVF